MRAYFFLTPYTQGRLPYGGAFLEQLQLLTLSSIMDRYFKVLSNVLF